MIKIKTRWALLATLVCFAGQSIAVSSKEIPSYTVFAGIITIPSTADANFVCKRMWIDLNAEGKGKNVKVKPQKTQGANTCSFALKVPEPPTASQTTSAPPPSSPVTLNTPIYRIELRNDGEIEYTSNPSGSPESTFCKIAQILKNVEFKTSKNLEVHYNVTTAQPVCPPK